MTKKYLLSGLFGLFVAVVVLGALVFAAQTWSRSFQADVVSSLTEKIAAQEVKISNQSTLMAASFVSEVAGTLMTDCVDRIRFDALLNSLSLSISTTELSELASMYDRCATFYPNRRIINAVALNREIEILEEYITVKQTLVNEVDEVMVLRLENWKTVALAEIEIAKLFSSQVAVQRTIIDLLQAGRTRQSVEIIAVLDEAQAISNQITYQLGLIEKYRLQQR